MWSHHLACSNPVVQKDIFKVHMLSICCFTRGHVKLTVGWFLMNVGV